MFSAPVVRFVIPTLGKNLVWLETCIKSIVNQSIPVDIVLIAPKNVSLSSFEERFGVRVEEEVGASLSAALNQGFRNLQSSVEYLAWLGDDDALAPGSLALAMGALQNDPDSVLVLGRVRHVTGDGASKWVVRSGAWAALYARLGVNFMAQPGSLMKRDAFVRVGGLDEELRNSMDQDLFLKLAAIGKVVYVPRELAAFRVHPNSISSTKGASDETRLVAQRYMPNSRFYRSLLVRLMIRLVDRVLLSFLSRIPHRPAPLVDGRAYYNA